MLKIGLCGLGIVGSGVYEIINQNPYLKELVEIKKILVKDLNKPRRQVYLSSIYSELETVEV